MTGTKRVMPTRGNPLAASIDNQNKRLTKVAQKQVNNNGNVGDKNKTMNLVIDPHSQNSQVSNKQNSNMKKRNQNVENNTNLFNNSFNSSDKLRFTEFTQTQHDNVKIQEVNNAQKTTKIAELDSQTNVVSKVPEPMTASPAQVVAQKQQVQSPPGSSKETIINEVMERLKKVQDQQKVTVSNSHEEEQRSMIQNVIEQMQNMNQNKENLQMVGNMSVDESGSQIAREQTT